MFSTLILAYLLDVSVLVVCLPLSLTVSSVNNAFHALLATFEKIFPHTIIGAFEKNAPHLERSSLVKEFPHTGCLIVGELASRFDVSVQIIGDIPAVGNVPDGVFHLIDFL